MFLIDTHVHTNRVSHCGKVEPAKLASLYKNAGYDAVIITDHISSGCKVFQSQLSWEEKIKYFFTGFDLAESFGKEVGLTVLPAFELTFDDCPEDFLVYGISKTWLLEHKDIHETDIEYFSNITRDVPSIIVQAHPFRPGLNVHNSPCIQGIEVYNGNPRHDSGNAMAMAYAEENSLLKTSGSDFHRTGDCARGGMKFREPISSIDQFVEVVRTGTPELVET